MCVVLNLSLTSQLSNFLQAPLGIDKHTPALPTARSAPKSRDDRLEAVPAVFTLALAREFQDLVVEGSWLQPDRGDTEGLCLLEDIERHGGGRAGDR